jgi:uncharacterized protein (UPF0216 family)
MKNRIEIFKSWLTDEIAGELLEGARIIEAHIPDEEKGFVLLERKEPKIDKEDGREFVFAFYQKADLKTVGFYLASEAVKYRIPEARKWAYRKFWDQD